MGIQFKIDVLAWAGFIAAVTATTTGCGADDTFSDEGSACVPSENEERVDGQCGIWVSVKGDDGNAGSPGSPVRTITEAIDRAWPRGKRIYLCAQTFDEAVLVPGGYTLYGGLDCDHDWRWVGDRVKTTLTAPEGEVPLSVNGAVDYTILEDLHVLARSIDPARTDLAGASSIAVITRAVPMIVKRSTLQAGDAAPGAPGEEVASERAPAGANGNVGNAACTASTVLGGAAVTNSCGAPDDRSDDSRSGKGGTGGITSGGDGDSGGPYGPSNDGAGETETAACTPGKQGAAGIDGYAGRGATGIGLFTLEGYQGIPGEDGTPGDPGQGGGGGGGARGGAGALMCPFAASAGGAGGGSGGAGGCGGLGGRGGGAGGVSVAIAALSASTQFEDVVLITGRGGDGGDGSPGQRGGAGGDGGEGGILGKAADLNAACRGGRGGNGGTGGHGGGGLGGHSIAIAYRIREPSLDRVTITVGEAGIGGRGATAEFNGGDGVKAKIYDIE
ncbi:PGRS family protein [Sorangium sp. So ce1036]|uniref:PGRS family protein n=1 Tax=Sorangium sp. So ce1036 TaxID=3133328 RepID=UPI003EFC5636